MFGRAFRFGAPHRRGGPRRLVAAAVTALAVVAAAGVAPVGANSDSPDRVTPGLAEARAAADAATAEFSAAQDELGRIDERLRAAETELAAAKENMDGLRDQVRQIAVDRYMQINPTPSIGGGDLLANEHAKVLLAVVTGRDLDALEEFRGQRERAEAATTELASAREDFERQQADADARRVDLDAELARLETIEADRLADVERRRAEQAAAAAAAAEAAAEQAARQAAAATTVPSPDPPAPNPNGNPDGSRPPSGGGGSSGGGWVCPVQGSRSFVDSWMAPRPGGRRHMGVDIMSPRGTPVVLPVGGAVTFRNDGLGGLTFNLNGDDGNYYYGAHLDRYAGLAPGRYPAGTVVGYVGDTGDARGTGTHLHFEIHRGGYGNAVNPYPTTRAHC